MKIRRNLFDHLFAGLNHAFLNTKPGPAPRVTHQLMNDCGMEASVLRSITLRVRDARKMSRFYSKHLGFKIVGTTKSHGFFLALPGDPQSTLQLVEDSNAVLSIAAESRMLHFALAYSEHDAWRRIVIHLINEGYDFEGLSDHGVSKSAYFRDPENNGLELAWDRPCEQWPRHRGRPAISTQSLSVFDLLEEPSQKPVQGKVRLGHIHLNVANLALAKEYAQNLGLEVTENRYPGALFLARDGYHHHLALNVWNANTAIPAIPNATGLIGFEMAGGFDESVDNWIDPLGNNVTFTRLNSSSVEQFNLMKHQAQPCSVP